MNKNKYGIILSATYKTLAGLLIKDYLNNCDVVSIDVVTTERLVKCIRFGILDWKWKAPSIMRPIPLKTVMIALGRGDLMPVEAWTDQERDIFYLKCRTIDTAKDAPRIGEEKPYPKYRISGEDRV